MSETLDILTQEIIKYQAREFTVEIRKGIRGTLGREVIIDKDNKYINNYCLYLYVNPDHFLFKGCKTDNYYNYDFGFDWHGGATYSDFVYNKKGKVISKCVGCDYQHSGDEMHNEIYSIAENTEVLRDFKRLIKFAENKQGWLKGDFYE